jgi:hypothetical protein
MRQHPAFYTISEMEDHVATARLTADLLLVIASSRGTIPAETLHLLGRPLHEAADRLKELFDIAFAATGGQP